MKRSKGLGCLPEAAHYLTSTSVWLVLQRVHLLIHLGDKKVWYGYGKPVVISFCLIRHLSAWAGLSTLNQKTLSRSAGSCVVPVNITFTVCPRLDSMRDTGGVEVNGTLIWLGSALSSPVSNQFWISKGRLPLFSRRTLTSFLSALYMIRVPEIMISANAGALVNNVLINNALTVFFYNGKHKHSMLLCNYVKTEK